MPRFEAARLARSGLPAWRPIVIPAHGAVWRRVQPQASDQGKGVTVPRINRNPFALPARAEAAEVGRAHGRGNDSRSAECVRDGAGTIVGAVLKGTMTAAVTVRLAAQLVTGPNGALHFHGSLRR